MEHILLQSGMPAGPLLLAGLLGAVLLFGLLKNVSTSGTSSQARPDYYQVARQELKQVSRYHTLTNYQQEFLEEYGAKLLQRGYDLEADGSRLNVTRSNEKFANFTITEGGSIDMMAHTKPGGWKTIEPDPRDYTESELKGKQNQLDQHLEN